VPKLKLTVGVLLIGALFVPLSKCSHDGKKQAAPPQSKTVIQKVFPRSDEQTDYDYGAARLGPSLNGVLTLIAFAWPLALGLLNKRIAGKYRAWIFYTLELLLCAGTIYWVYATTVARTRLWGAYQVFALMGGYALAAVLDLWRNFTRPPARN
jgi:hypothetical protein